MKIGKFESSIEYKSGRLIDSPANQVPVNQFGEQQATIVYGPQELGILYEGNESQLKFGLKGFWSRRINGEHRLVYSN